MQKRFRKFFCLSIKVISRRKEAAKVLFLLISFGIFSGKIVCHVKKEVKQLSAQMKNSPYENIRKEQFLHLKVKKHTQVVRPTCTTFKSDWLKKLFLIM